MKLVVWGSGQYGGGDVRGAPFKRSPPNKARIGDKDGKTSDSRFFKLQFLLSCDVGSVRWSPFSFLKPGQHRRGEGFEETGGHIVSIQEADITMNWDY